jgi:uracil-DNA glycosylase
MNQSEDHPEKLKADLLKWVRQNESTGLGWFLDEGPVADDPAPAVEKTAAVGVPEPEPAPPISDPAFQLECDRFVQETLALMAQQPPTPPASDPLLTKHHGDSQAAMNDLREEVLPCRMCNLAESRTQVVFGAGSAQARVMFIGEAPGHEEDLQGQPFVGASGQLLTKIIGAIGFDRRHIFIGNILKCRPPQNRDPLPNEVTACEPFLKRQIAIIQPKIICCLGRVAAQTLLRTDLSLGKLRGSVHFYEGVPVMATYHPAALLRNPSWKRDTWNDVRRLRALHDSLDRGNN